MAAITHTLLIKWSLKPPCPLLPASSPVNNYHIRPPDPLLKYLLTFIMNMFLDVNLRPRNVHEEIFQTQPL